MYPLDEEKRSFWTPGGIATLVAAISGLITVLFTAGLLPNPPATPNATTSSVGLSPTVTRADTSPDMQQFVGEFLQNAVIAEILAYTESDASYAELYMTGDALRSIRQAIAELNSQGLYQEPVFDFESFRLVAVRARGSDKIEADTCETWAADFYSLADGAWVGERLPALVPQTITIERSGSAWYITRVAFFNPPSFC